MGELLRWLVAEIKKEPTLDALQARVFPDAAPEGTKNPCLVYQLVAADGEATVDGGPAKDATLAYQIRIYGESRKSANGLREAFRQKFEGMEPVAIGGSQVIEGSAWGELADTFASGTKDYGALGVIESTWRRTADYSNHESGNHPYDEDDPGKHYGDFEADRLKAIAAGNWRSGHALTYHGSY